MLKKTIFWITRSVPKNSKIHYFFEISLLKWKQSLNQTEIRVLTTSCCLNRRAKGNNSLKQHKAYGMKKYNTDLIKTLVAFADWYHFDRQMTISGDMPNFFTMRNYGKFHRSNLSCTEIALKRLWWNSKGKSFLSSSRLNNLLNDQLKKG